MPATPTVARWLGRLAGAGAAVVLLAQGHVATGTEVPPLRLTLEAVPAGETAVRPVGRVMDARALAAGAAAALVTLHLADRTGRGTRVRLRAAGPPQEAEGLVRVRLSVPPRTLFDGSLHDLRQWSRAVRMGPADETAVTVRAWLAPDVPGAYRGREVRVRLELRTAADAL
jgi:hypothetical protein